MDIQYRKAVQSDVPLLVQMRKTVLIAANGLDQSVDLSCIDAASCAYFTDMEKHTTYLAMDGETVVGVGSVDYHIEMPTVSNPTGRCAFLMNIYTEPDYRRRGIAERIVRLLIEDARSNGAGIIMLESTKMGEPLYRKMGFVDAHGYMRFEYRGRS